MLCWRGVVERAEAKCTTPELRELLKLDGVQVRLEGADSNAEALQSLVAEQDQDAATLPAEVRRRKGNLQVVFRSSRSSRRDRSNCAE